MFTMFYDIARSYVSRLACLSVASRFPLLLHFHHHNYHHNSRHHCHHHRHQDQRPQQHLFHPHRDLRHLNCILAVESPLIFFLQHRNRKCFAFFECYKMNPSVKHCDIRPGQWGELLARSYGLQAKLIVLSFIQNVSDIYLHRCKIPVFIFLLLRM